MKLTKKDFLITGWYVYPQGLNDEANRCIDAMLSDYDYQDFMCLYGSMLNPICKYYWDKGVVEGKGVTDIQKEFIRCAIEYHKLFMSEVQG